MHIINWSNILHRIHKIILENYLHPLHIFIVIIYSNFFYSYDGFSNILPSCFAGTLATQPWRIWLKFTSTKPQQNTNRVYSCGVHITTWWRHQMEAFSTLLALCAGNSPVTGEFPSQRPVARSFDVFLIYAWTKGGVNNRDAGGLRRHRAHYDVTVMRQKWNMLLQPIWRSDTIYGSPIFKWVAVTWLNERAPVQ